MAPPRKGATAIVDDSRSEASSGTREHKGTSSKGRKGANGSAAFKAAAAAANVTSAPAAQSVEQSEDLPKVGFFFFFLQSRFELLALSLTLHSFFASTISFCHFANVQSNQNH